VRPKKPAKMPAGKVVEGKIMAAPGRRGNFFAAGDSSAVGAASL
jgi:hypothetical protein